MDNAIAGEPTMEETRKVEAILAEIFAQAERIDERIAKDQQETERLRLETRKILATLKVW